MSFSTDVKNELNSLQIKGNCCKRSYIFGALMSAQYCEDGTIIIKLTDDSTTQKLCALLVTLYKITPTIVTCSRGCYHAAELTFKSNSIAEFLKGCDDTDIEKVKTLLDRTLKCNTCVPSFLAAVFCSCATVSDPKKSYTLEIRCPNQKRAEAICAVIDKYGLNVPCITQRKGAIGLFYRNENAIEDFLTACGANNALFTFFDAAVEKNLRNTENRATNCVAKNISKSVSAAALQVAAIEALIANGMFDDLADELKKTAKLRLEYPDISLTELMELHKPSISKSGLNHRLSRLIDEAKNKGLI